MSRTMSTAFRNAVTGDLLRPFSMIVAEFDGGTLRFWDGYGDLDYDSNTYTGAGDLIGIDVPQETQGVEARQASFVLNGVNDAIIAAAQGDEYQGKSITVHLGALEADGSVVADPIQVFAGLMDVIDTDDDPLNPLISMSAEHSLVRLSRSNERRYTPEDQKLDDSSDTAFKGVAALQDAEIVWGQS